MFVGLVFSSIAGVAMPLMAVIYEKMVDCLTLIQNYNIFEDEFSYQISKYSLYLIYIAINTFVAIYIYIAIWVYTGERYNSIRDTTNDSTLLKTFQDCLETMSNPNKRKNRCIEEVIKEFVVTRKDQLCSSDVESQDTDCGELAKDLLSIITVFTARHNGLQAASYKRQREKKASNKDRKTTKKQKFKDSQNLFENFENDENDKCWVLKTPSSIHDNAFLEFKKNLKTELEKKQKFKLRSNGQFYEITTINNEAELLNQTIINNCHDAILETNLEDFDVLFNFNFKFDPPKGIENWINNIWDNEIEEMTRPNLRGVDERFFKNSVEEL
ncbi:21032_t:CDS:2, partial [Racocetra persica]